MQKLRLLLLTNIFEDAELLCNALKYKGLNFNLTPVYDIPELIQSVKQQSFDAVLGVSLLPESNAISILQKLKDIKAHIPFILITDDIVKDDVVNVMKEGAADCILKNNLEFLSAAIIDAIRKAEQENERRQYIDKVMANEQLLSAGTHLAQLGCWQSDLVNNTERWSDEQLRILGADHGKKRRPLENLIRKLHPEDVMAVTQLISNAVKNLDRLKFDCRIISPDESVKYISVEMDIIRDAKGIPCSINGCLQNISEIHTAQLNEKKIMSDLVQRNKDLEQFAYIISHNLRAPIANIIGVSDALCENDLSDNEQKEFTNALSASVKKLDNFITDLNHILQVRRNVNEHMELVNFTQLVEEIKSSIGVFLDDQFIMILCDFEEVPDMWTLKSYMRSIFFNLISNSIKYRKTEVAPEIEIKSRKNKDKVELTFKDNSIGINLDKESNHIFGLYQRFHPEYAEGKGMGLFMVKTQVETLGGRISVRSKVGEGTEFIIEFETQKAPH